MSSKNKIKVTLVRSTISALPNHKNCVKGLGLKRMHHSVVLPDTLAIRGMINKVSYLLFVEEA